MRFEYEEISNSINKVNRIIDNAKEKIKSGEDIKTEIFLLDMIYYYAKEEELFKEIIDILEPILLEFRSYQLIYNYKRKKKRYEDKIKQLEIEQLDKSKKAWIKKPLLYRLIHFNDSPYREDYSSDQKVYKKK